jgi:hypothetical protein
MDRAAEQGMNTPMYYVDAERGTAHHNSVCMGPGAQCGYSTYSRVLAQGTSPTYAA